MKTAQEMGTSTEDKNVRSRRWDQLPRLEKGTSTTNSLMAARVGLKPDISIAVGVVSHPVDVLTKGIVYERLKLGSTSVHLLA